MKFARLLPDAHVVGGVRGTVGPGGLEVVDAGLGVEPAWIDEVVEVVGVVGVVEVVAIASLVDDAVGEVVVDGGTPAFVEVSVARPHPAPSSIAAPMTVARIVGVCRGTGRRIARCYATAPVTRGGRR